MPADAAPEGLHEVDCGKGQGGEQGRDHRKNEGWGGEPAKRGYEGTGDAGHHGSDRAVEGTGEEEPEDPHTEGEVVAGRPHNWGHQADEEAVEGQQVARPTVLRRRTI